MKELRCTLVSDGSSDRALIPSLTWLLQQHQVKYPIQFEWADLRRLRKPPQGLAQRIEKSLELYPCDLLFVHRDAERSSRQRRVKEIHKALAEVGSWSAGRTVCVVPVRMMEAWLLIEETALRQAAGNPLGKKPLQFPPIEALERLPSPKKTLHKLLRQASELTGRRLRKFPVSAGVQIVAGRIDDFSPLQVLPAFAALEGEIGGVVKEQGWRG